MDKMLNDTLYDDGNLVLDTESEAIVINKPSDLNVAENPTPTTLYSQYHTNEIEQNKKIYATSRNIIWAGFGVIIIGVVSSFFSLITVSIIATVCGLITEFISGTIFVFLTQSNKEKHEYYRQLSFDEERKEILNVAETLENSDKMTIINKLVDNYCDRRKK